MTAFILFLYGVSNRKEKRSASIGENALLLYLRYFQLIEHKLDDLDFGASEISTLLAEPYHLRHQERPLDRLHRVVHYLDPSMLQVYKWRPDAEGALIPLALLSEYIPLNGGID